MSDWSSLSAHNLMYDPLPGRLYSYFAPQLSNVVDMSLVLVPIQRPRGLSSEPRVSADFVGDHVTYTWLIDGLVADCGVWF